MKKLKLKKETIRDLTVKGHGKDVKGGITAACAASANTNCKASCVVVCGGGWLLGR